MQGGGSFGFNYNSELLNKDTHNGLYSSSVKPNMIFDYDNNKVYIDLKI